MKRSRIFLGASTCILAVAAFAASKVQKFNAFVTRYYCTSAVSGTNLHPRCLPYSDVNCEANSPTVTCFYTFSTAPLKKYALYTKGTQDPSAIYTCGAGTANCLNIVKYLPPKR